MRYDSPTPTSEDDKMKHLVCIVEGCGLEGIGGELGHYMIAKNDQDRSGDVEITSRHALPYIMETLGDGMYQGYGSSAIYKQYPIRKRLVRAFFKYAHHDCKLSRNAAKSWARAMADGYFFRDGQAISEMIQTIMIDYDGDFGQESFDSYVADEISYW
ncbi:hypothetical protein HOT14_gp18 [Escherichia phage vB_EcoS_IME347]|uniref:Uncharacterized protein n=1 Tax=Escherichia phage vB_EcoS_IME347 TaxID=2496546 RepID=A0A2S1GS43_9CAUD|nr:hypothetical protein HOT14_gp18 [Escherichia phage vB_EcoS_IME347]AWD92218.1 hypothetical protein [Escherichia phage vB_EcoS_IME347]